jgi:hypothetical protein
VTDILTPALTHTNQAACYEDITEHILLLLSIHTFPLTLLPLTLFSLTLYSLTQFLSPFLTHPLPSHSILSLVANSTNHPRSSHGGEAPASGQLMEQRGPGGLPPRGVFRESNASGDNNGTDYGLNFGIILSFLINIEIFMAILI